MLDQKTLEFLQAMAAAEVALAAEAAARAELIVKFIATFDTPPPVDPLPVDPPPPPVVVGETIPTGDFLYEELHNHSGKTLTVLPGTRLIRRDVPPANPDHANGGIVNHGTLIAVRLPGQPDIVFTSENPRGNRGHMMFHAGSKTQLRGVKIIDMGRTAIAPLSAANPIAVYACHWHKAGDCPDSFIEDSEIYDTVPGFRYGVTIHGANKIGCRRNHIHDKGGAGIYLEDGTERDNLIEDNLIEDIIGTSGDWTRQGPRPDDRAGDGGFEGSAIWCRGPRNPLRRNVGRRCPYGFMYFCQSMHQAILEFSDNVAEQCFSGLEPWYIGYFENYEYEKSPPSTVLRFTARNCRTGIVHYPSIKLTYDSPTLEDCVVGFDGRDYIAYGGAILNPTARRCKGGIIPSPLTFGDFPIVGGSLEGCDADIILSPLYRTGGGKGCTPRRVLIDGTLLGGKVKISMDGLNRRGTNNFVLPDEVHVANYQGVSGDDFRVYYNEQSADSIMPATDANRGDVGCPVVGLTNAQAWEQHGVSLAGAVVPGDAITLPGIKGLVQRQ